MKNTSKNESVYKVLMKLKYVIFGKKWWITWKVY